MKVRTGFLFVVMCSAITNQVLLSEKVSLEFVCEHDLLEQICDSIRVIRAQIVEPIDSHWNFGYVGDFKSVVDVLFRLSQSVDDLLGGGFERTLIFESSKHEAKVLLRG
jgi:hypothetical protein